MKQDISLHQVVIDKAHGTGDTVGLAPVMVIQIAGAVAPTPAAPPADLFPFHPDQLFDYLLEMDVLAVRDAGMDAAVISELVRAGLVLESAPESCGCGDICALSGTAQCPGYPRPVYSYAEAETPAETARWRVAVARGVERWRGVRVAVRVASVIVMVPRSRCEMRRRLADGAGLGVSGRRGKAAGIR